MMEKALPNPNNESDLLKRTNKTFKHLKVVNEDKDEDTKTSVVVENGFDHWDDVKHGDEMQFDEVISDDESDSNQSPCVEGQKLRVLGFQTLTARINIFGNLKGGIR
ncbi:Uncharacterized protein TCM_028621 [Theobroma cacao]|uniref:Uncharacterized protein n=1 Tax=Theobroma cacao TaxID=3641 RepID=A0A061GC39_THECC|nr:Uncharacterized protein TCM_028621 [Theobroma cacao]